MSDLYSHDQNQNSALPFDGAGFNNSVQLLSVSDL